MHVHCLIYPWLHVYVYGPSLMLCLYRGVQNTREHVQMLRSNTAINLIAA